MINRGLVRLWYQLGPVMKSLISTQSFSCLYRRKELKLSAIYRTAFKQDLWNNYHSVISSVRVVFKSVDNISNLYYCGNNNSFNCSNLHFSLNPFKNLQILTFKHYLEFWFLGTPRTSLVRYYKLQVIIHFSIYLHHYHWETNMEDWSKGHRFQYNLASASPLPRRSNSLYYTSVITIATYGKVGWDSITISILYSRS